MLTSSVEEQGSRVSCPGEKVTFTCTVLRGTTLQWMSDAFSSAPRTFSLFQIDSTREPRTYGEFTVNLTVSVPDPGKPGFGDLTSSLIFTATPELNGTVIQCSNQLTIMSKTTIVPGTVQIHTLTLNSNALPQSGLPRKFYSLPHTEMFIRMELLSLFEEANHLTQKPSYSGPLRTVSSSLDAVLGPNSGQHFTL